MKGDVKPKIVLLGFPNTRVATKISPSDIGIKIEPCLNFYVVINEYGERGAVAMPDDYYGDIHIASLLARISEPPHINIFTTRTLHRLLDIMEELLINVDEDVKVYEIMDVLWYVLNYVWKWRTREVYVPPPKKYSKMYPRAIYMMRRAEKPLPSLGPRSLLRVGWRATALLKLAEIKLRMLKK